MWIKIIEKTKIKIGDKILKYSSSEDHNNRLNITEQDKKNDLYEVISITQGDIVLRWLVNGTIDKLKIENVIRQLNYSDLINGEWMYLDGEQ